MWFSKKCKKTKTKTKQNNKITGVKINYSEYLLSQYADDSSLILDDNPKSLDQS
jgi:hypothetical protein